jgi:hypothetical protein
MWNKKKPVTNCFELARFSGITVRIHVLLSRKLKAVTDFSHLKQQNVSDGIKANTHQNYLQ